MRGYLLNSAGSLIFLLFISLAVLGQKTNDQHSWKTPESTVKVTNNGSRYIDAKDFFDPKVLSINNVL